MTSNGGAPSSLIPLLHSLQHHQSPPGWKRSTQKESIEPSRLQKPHHGSQSDVCLVCNQNESRYTCPRCEIPYCSLECYKLHDGGEAAQADASSSCTEGFYQDRVSSVLRMEQKEGATEMHRILQRSHEAEQADSDLGGGDVLSEDELWAISDALEAGLDLGDDALDEILSPEAKRAFMKALESGALDQAVEEWHPWWTEELVFACDESSDVNSETQQNALSRGPSLDERLLGVPSFNKLRPGMKPSPMLRFNLLEILYATARTLRLYHGVSNAKASCQEASETLMASSSVLREDARYSCVADVMMGCTTASTQALSENADCNAHWNVLAKDVVLLTQNHRHVAHAIFDAMDILEAARKALRESGDTEGTAKLRLARKKLEFYLSWSRETDQLQTSGAETREWIEEWKDSDHQAANNDCLWMPNMGASPQDATGRRANETEGLLTEVSSARLKDS